MAGAERTPHSESNANTPEADKEKEAAEEEEENDTSRRHSECATETEFVYLGCLCVDFVSAKCIKQTCAETSKSTNNEKSDATSVGHIVLQISTGKRKVGLVNFDAKTVDRN
jgi:hypothetical protein